MKARWKVFVALVCLVAAESAYARGLGKFVGGLVARGVVSGAARSMQSKTYSPDVLTVDQLVQCLRKASALDEESTQLEAKKSELQSASKDIENLKSRLEMKSAMVNRRIQSQVDSFNAEIDSYNVSAARLKSREDDFNRLVSFHNAIARGFNAECAKQYYADDMESARKLAGI
jgi:chromosome segregation ATPase